VLGTRNPPPPPTLSLLQDAKWVAMSLIDCSHYRLKKLLNTGKLFKI